MAAVLASGPAAVLSHRSAAALWGIRASSGRIEVTTPRNAHSTHSIRRHCSLLPNDEIGECDGIPVTTVPRTIFDLAADSPPHVVESVLREAEYLRLDDALSLPHLLERYPGRRGSVNVRAALARLAEAPGRVRRGLEERFLPFLDHHRLPRPHLNAPIDTGPKTYQVDCLWLRQRHIVELDSWQAHNTRATFADDRLRDRRLHAAGYAITRLTWTQLDLEPTAIAADLRTVLTHPSSPPATPRTSSRNCNRT